MTADTTRPQTLDRAGIEALIPHRGPMCLLARMTACSETGIECIATNHRDADHPLRTAGGLMASAAIEYAAQAMAVHGGLAARAAGAAPAPGFLASARGVRLAVWSFDELPAIDPDELIVRCERQAADAARILYAFVLQHGGVEIASGRVAVVLQPAVAPAAPLTEQAAA